MIALGCARQANPNIERGSNYKFRAGYPEVRFSPMGYLNQNNEPQINLVADIVYGSLIFKDVNGKQKANLSVDVDFKSKNNNEILVNSKHYEIDISKEDISITDGRQSYVFQEHIEVAAGNYEISLTVTDKNSGKKTIRSSIVSIPSPESEKIDLTNIQMMGKNIQIDSSWYPITTYDVPGRVDSLMFVIQVTNNSNNRPIAVHTNLFEIKADTSVARPMFFSNYSPSTIEYQGIDYDEKTVLQKSTRKLSENGSVFIEYRFKRQQRGNYRFEVRTRKNESELFKARDYSVKSSNYPNLRAPRELALPLIYLMEEDNYESLMAIQDQDSLKRAIDEFWLKQLGGKVEARQVFEQPKVNTEFYPFDHFLLQRDYSFSSLAHQQRRLWLSGLILKRNL